MNASGAFVIEASVALDSGTDPAAIGAAVTVELCGHWEHEGACRWPHHTAVVRSSDRTVTRTVVAPGDDGAEVERRIRESLAAGTRPWIEGGWTFLDAARVVPLPDELERAARIARTDV